jgi:hypothetical protein
MSDGEVDQLKKSAKKRLDTPKTLGARVSSADTGDIGIVVLADSLLHGYDLNLQCTS